MTKRFASLVATLALAAAIAHPALAAIEVAPGWIFYGIPTPTAVQGGVVRSGDVILVGQGSFGAGLQHIVREQDNGHFTTIATGFNSLGGFALAPNGTLFVVDNGGEVVGAVTGDTVYAIPDALTRTTALPALGAEVVPAGSIPFAQDIVIDGNDLLVSDAAGPGAGRVVRISGGVVTPIITGLGYAAGLAVDGARLIVGDVDGSFAGSVASYSLEGTFQSSIAGGLSGEYDHALDYDGNLLVTGGFLPDFSSSNILAIAPNGDQSQRAWGFSFTTALFHDISRNETLVNDFGRTAIIAICPDSNDNEECDVCIGGGVITNHKASVSKPRPPAGDDTFKFSGDMTFGPTPAVDPVTTGARIVLHQAAGDVADIPVPGGAYDAVTRQGWKVNGAGTVFTFLSKIGVEGITKIVLKASTKTPGLYSVKITGKKGKYPVSASNLPLQVTFALRPTGQCAIADFSGPSPICTFNSAGTSMKCK